MKTFDGWGNIPPHKLPVDLPDEVALTSYYTPYPVVDRVWELVGKHLILRMKFTALEPSCGDGRFIDQAIEHHYAGVWTSLDIDDTVDTVHDNHMAIAFEDFWTDEKIDLITGNPPYGQWRVADKALGIPPMKIHEFFVAKSLLMLKPGGVMAYVLPTTQANRLSANTPDGFTVEELEHLPTGTFKNARVECSIIVVKKEVY